MHGVARLLTLWPAPSESPVPGQTASDAQAELLLAARDAQVLDVHRRDRAVEGGGEERLAVVVGGVHEHVALEAEVAVPARHEFGGESLHAHVALRGGFGLLHGSLRVAHIHFQAGQESAGGVDGRQQQVLVAPAVGAAGGSGQSQ